MTRYSQENTETVDFLSLLETVWKSRITVLAIAFVSFGLGLLYTLNTNPIFESKIEITLVNEIEVSEYVLVEYELIEELKSSALTPRMLFEEVIDRVESVSAVAQFVRDRQSETFEDQQTLSNDELLEAVSNLMSSSISIVVDEKGQRATISFLHTSASESKNFLNDLIEWAKLDVQRDISNVFVNRVDRELARNQILIDTKIRSQARMLEQELAALQEGLLMATELGVVKPRVGVLLESDSQLSQQIQAYRRGSDVLSAEIAALKRRYGDSRFIKGLGSLKQKSAYLKKIKELRVPVGQAVRVDKPATTPQSSVLPNKKLILVLSLIFGTMIGIIYVLMRDALRIKAT